MNKPHSSRIIVAGCAQMAYVAGALEHTLPNYDCALMYGADALRLINEPANDIVLVVTEAYHQVNSGIPHELTEDGRIAGALLLKKMRERRPQLPLILINPREQKVLKPDVLLKFIDVTVLSRPDAVVALARELLSQFQLAAA